MSRESSALTTRRKAYLIPKVLTADLLQLPTFHF